MVGGEETSADQNSLRADARAASRTMLELVATLMEKSFETMGEGAVLGTLPAYSERFGAMNAIYMGRNFVRCDPSVGAVSALTPLNVISRVTGTDFDMPQQNRARAVKRLKNCEFLDAFKDRGEFPKAMMCLLHKATYQGSVNSTLQEKDGYEVDLRTRILFGDPHCDFVVRSRSPRPDAPDQECEVTRQPAPEECDDLSYGFYTFLLTSFVDYLTNHLPADTVHDILRACAAEVGSKVYGLMDATGTLPQDPVHAARAVLRMGGREFQPGPPESPDMRVASCPQAAHIITTSKGNEDPEAARAVRENACRLCKNLVQGAVDRVAPGCNVVRKTALTLGDDDCHFSVEP